MAYIWGRDVMQLEQLIQEYAESGLQRRQGIFASVFLMQNRLQTACDKLDEEITMKQWLLLAMAGTSEVPMSLTDLGILMGCSRQNVKKLALSLEQKGFLRLGKKQGDSRVVCVILEEKMRSYTERVGDMQQKVMDLLFRGFTEAEICSLYQGIMNLQRNIEEVEKYVEVLHE